MRHVQSVLIGSVIALLGAANANANATYQWHSTSPGPYVTATGGELVFTNAAYFSGSVDFHVHDPWTSPWIQYENCNVDSECRITNSPVISATLIFNLTAGGWVPAVRAQPGSPGFPPSYFPFSSSITFNNDGTLTGDLSLEDISEVANAYGSHYNWSVGGYASDFFGTGECTGLMFCDGGSGYWQLSNVPVPEPVVWPLFGLGALGLLGLRGLRGKG